jgi:LCP family protein required for cell wall assembly
MTSGSSRKRPRSGPRLPLWALGLLIILAVGFLVVSSVWLFRTVQSLASGWEITNPVFRSDGSSGGSGAADPDNPQADTSVDSLSILSVEAFKPWSGRERVTILVLGIDERCDEVGPTRTDTMMLVTVDPVNMTGAMLSIPRDLWVEIPGFGVEKINQAHRLGDLYEYPEGGPGLAVDTVEAALGINVGYYLTVDFEAFTQVVDEIGGIEVTVPEDIQDPSYPDNCYGYDPFYIEAGKHNLDGPTALKYARTRVTFGGDVDRAGRQQQVVMAIRDRVLHLDMIPQLLVRAPEFWKILQDNVRTNLALDEIMQLGLLAQDIPDGNIQSAVIDYDYVYNQVTPDGQAVLVPIRENIRVLRDQLFARPVVPTAEIVDLPGTMAEESARVAIFNGTPNFGLAAETEAYLINNDFNIVEIGNADSSEYRTTQIIDYGSHPATTRYLTRLMLVPPLNVSTSNQPYGEFDVLVILGGDWEVPGR